MPFADKWPNAIFNNDDNVIWTIRDGFVHFWHELRKEQRNMFRRKHGDVSAMVRGAICFNG